MNSAVLHSSNHLCPPAPLAAALRAASDPMRLEILRIMQRDSFGVLELCQIFNIQQPSMSHHLKVMTKAGILDSRREGNSVFYKRAQSSSSLSLGLLDQIFALADCCSPSATVHRRVEAVQRARKEASKSFFKQNVHRFQEQQDLIAGHADYGEAVKAFLHNRAGGVWLEVGPGAGELLQSSVAEFSEVIALDISQEMLDQSRQRMGKAAVTYMLGDPGDARADGLRADTISCSMVLHHVPSPAAVVVDMAAILNPDGQLLICDLDQHDQDWVYESCGDLWLGFSAEEISHWAVEAGLLEGRAQFLALRNGFRVQIREFIKT